ncbi:TetR/AcrR family transcriptional regulator [Kineothrix alysoides]|uniref:TetR/AcrR family transcriptional regulator n=1 Tax=Kineothrix alysoides TaxID=1469948 RepID=UPI001FA7901D|nr:TetR/AcrR family transcriptional regulator [Kineothrix alysoides]
MTTRNEQKEKRRQLILWKALELFVKNGYAETKINDIARAADMSVGLLFHYFESKEQLYEELIRMGVEGTKEPQKMEFSNPLEFFTGFLDALFLFSSQQPWVFLLFVLMAQTRRSDGVPAHIKALAMEVDQMEQSAEIIRMGQSEGVFRDGDPYALSAAFWCSVQGIMEQLAVTPDMPLPETEWLIDVIRSKG